MCGQAGSKIANMNEVVGDVDELYAMLQKGNTKSLLKKHLTQERFDLLKDKKTSIGGTLAQCINSGCKNMHSGVGLYACDPEAYEVFKELFDPLIMDYHKITKVEHPTPDFGDMDKLGFDDLDPAGEFIVSTRVRVGRSHAGFPFPPGADEQKRRDMEDKTIKALEHLDGDLKGEYFSLEKMTKEDEKQLIEDHFLFKDDDKCLRSACGYNDWPIGRGIYFSKDKKFLTWINEEDHLRFISMQKGGDLATVWKRLVTAVKTLEKNLNFAKSNRHGYLTFCPTNLGTTCRASVHIKVPKLAKAARETEGSGSRLDEVCEKFNLQPRGIHGEHTESVGGVYDISNKRRMGLTEFDAITEMKNGIVEIMKIEKELEIMSLEELWKKLKNGESNSLLKKHLTEPIYNKLKDKVTYLKGTLADCIRSGCNNLDSGCGIYACDAEAYDVFSDVLFPVIKDYHKVDEVKHPNPDFGDIKNLGFGDLDPSKKYIISTRVRVGRSLAGYPFPPTATLKDRMEMEARDKDAFETLKGELKGTYYPLYGMNRATQLQLTEDHFLFNDSDRFLREASGFDDWPVGRGIFHNPQKTFLVWVNEEDHLRFISMQMGGDLAAVYTRLVTAVQAMEKSGLKFAHHHKLGYLTFCPTNLGTTLRASVHIRIPKLSTNPEFKAFCDRFNLQARGIHGEHTESVGGVYDISNKRRLGLTEIEAVQEMRKGVEAVIAEERKLDGSSGPQSTSRFGRKA
ncbi:Taurocyamine kinase [Mizuhopecten yessoensis]|uniref:Taurocyamine kinase n=1 Tax=Mizuhopecten yessoensis TaxID=6573 RepID=A0A210PM53_MIZYE|nr:Taurocyamine kinase [Mizuhopecten yessoensis]